MKAAKYDLDVDFLNQQIMEFVKSKLDMTEAKYNIYDNGCISFDYKGKSYSAVLKFDDLPF